MACEHSWMLIYADWHHDGPYRYTCQTYPSQALAPESARPTYLCTHCGGLIARDTSPVRPARPRKHRRCMAQLAIPEAAYMHVKGTE
jgi:hypothetical protein